MLQSIAWDSKDREGVQGPVDICDKLHYQVSENKDKTPILAQGRRSVVIEYLDSELHVPDRLVEAARAQGEDIM